MAYIEQLQLSQDLESLLQDLNLTVVNSLRDLTTPDLLTKGLTEEQIQLLYARLDYYYDRRFRSEVLCPQLPEHCHYIEVQYLELPPQLLAKVQASGFEYFYELALQRRHHLSEEFSKKEIHLLEVHLLNFLDAYRAGEIELEIEDD